jgi:hypothetical protein
MTWTSAQNKDIEIRIDLEHPKKIVEYRLDGESDWNPTPFQGYKFNCGIDNHKVLVSPPRQPSRQPGGYHQISNRYQWINQSSIPHLLG